MRIAILSDIHSNLIAFQAVLNDIQQQKVDDIYCLGDVVGYGPQPAEVIKLLIENRIKTVRGNHDEAISTGHFPFEFTREAILEVNLNREKLDEAALDYLYNLPTSISQNNLRFVHGLPPDSFQDYIAYSPISLVRESFNNFKEQIAFVGHTHQFGIYELSFGYVNKHEFRDDVFQLNGNKTIINVGSVGLSRDKDERAGYAIYDENEHCIIKRRVTINENRHEFYY
jgi:predicted phosphodiesterase